MALKAGIIGLPNVGKSTLFNAITSNKVEAANYPFATIEPNSGIVELNDERMDELLDVFQSKKAIKATFEFKDIAGLVKGASLGEGLGNKFLSDIRDVDALCHVVRCFEDLEILHVEGNVDPIRDINIINMELIFADLEVAMKRKERIEKRAITTKDIDALFELEVVKKIINVLLEEKPIRSIEFTKEESRILKSFNMLTAKPIIYVANVLETEINNPYSNELFIKVEKLAKDENTIVIPISAQVESELINLNNEEKKEFLKELGIKQSGLDALALATYSLLGLGTFFTAGPQELRAWTFVRGMKAPECGGIIHSDFERGFIRAEVFSYEDAAKYKSETKIKEYGKLRIEGKEYVVQDGDIIHFRFNV